MKTGNDNKRTKRKEIQFSESEYAMIEKKANGRTVIYGGIYPRSRIG